MIFSIQRFIEDHLESRRLEDIDQYAVGIANLYDQSRKRKSDAQILASMHRMRTAFFRVNQTLNRADFEKSLLGRLDSRFKKKLLNSATLVFPGGVAKERVRIRAARRSIHNLLKEFKNALESRAIDAFWISRKRGQLRSHPEKIAQALLVMFAKGVVGDCGVVLRELASGIGFVDMSIILSARTPHLIELKILVDNFVGADQLEDYMRNERRNQGWLTIIDTVVPAKKLDIPKTIVTQHGTIKTLVVDVNPIAPSRL